MARTGNTFLRPLVNFIDRIPLSERATEATYQVHMAADAEHRGEVRDALVETLEAANYPLRDVDVLERGDDEVELVATLAATSIDPVDLDQVAHESEKADGVAYATWTSTVVD